jgi:hypothetical protein
MAGLGIVFGADFVSELLELVGAFPGHEGEGSGEAVGEAVLGDSGFAFVCDGTGRVLGVGLVGEDLGGCGHGVCSLIFAFGNEKSPRRPGRGLGAFGFVGRRTPS